MPNSMAVARAIGLNVEPGWREPCVARSNWSREYGRVDVIARMSPVFGLIETTAASGSPGVLRMSCIASSAQTWSLGSTVVRMRRPPLRTASGPNAGSSFSSLRTSCTMNGSRSLRYWRPAFRRSGWRTSSCVLVLGDVARVPHGPQHVVAPGDGGLRVVERVEARGLLHEARQQRRLRRPEPPRRDVEVGLRRGLDAVRVVAVEDGVQVGREDLVLRPLVLELQRQPGLADLAVERRAPSR